MKKLAINGSFIFFVLFAPFVDKDLQAQSQPCTLHVSTLGSDANDGRSESGAFRTIQQAVNTAVPGDVVCVKTGVYDGIRIYPGGGIGRSGTPENPVVYRTFGDGPVTIDGNSGAGIWLEASYLEFHRFKVTSSDEPSMWNIGIFLAGKDSPCCTGAGTSYVLFKDMEVYGASEQGILGGPDDTDFINLHVHHNGKVWYTDQGYYLSGSRNRIIGNIIHDNASAGIQLWNTSSDPERMPNHTLVSDNIIFANGFTVSKTSDGQGSDQYGYGIVLGGNGPPGEGNVFQNNLLFANFPNGISIGKNMANTLVVNNTVVGNIYGIGIDGFGNIGTVVRNNIVYDNSSEAVQAWLQANRPALLGAVDTSRHGPGRNLNAYNGPLSNFDGYSLDYNLWDPRLPFVWKGELYNTFAAYQSASNKEWHSFVGDPQLTNQLGNDFHLMPGSLAINAGTPEGAPSTDFEGNPRPQGAGYDIGAYEYALDGDTTPPTVPAGLTVSAVSSTQINLSWAASTDNVGVAGYRIYRDGSQIATATGTSYQDTGRSPSTMYTYRVAAYDAASNVSAQSSQASATTPTAPDTKAPTVPTGLTATVVSPTQINLSWTPSTDNVGVTGYKIYQNNTQIGTTAATSYQSTGLKPNTSYSYRVAAYDGAGNISAKSLVVTTKTQPLPSTMFTIGDRVQTISNASVRSAPSSSGKTSGTQLKGAMGRVAGGPWYWNLQWWWQIDFDSGIDGWVAQGKLKKIVQ